MARVLDRRLFSVGAMVCAWMLFLACMEIGRNSGLKALMTVLRLGEWWALAVLILAACQLRWGSAQAGLFASDRLLMIVLLMSAGIALIHHQSLTNVRTWIMAGLAAAMWSGWWLSRTMAVKDLIRIVAIGGLLMYVFFIGAFGDRLIKMVAFDYPLTEEEWGAFGVNARSIGVPFGLMFPLIWMQARNGGAGRVFYVLAWPMLVLMTALVIASQGRGALLATALGLIGVSCFFTNQRQVLRTAWRDYGAVLGGAVLTYLVAAYVLWPDVFSGHAGFENKPVSMVSDSGRLVLWRLGLSQWWSGNIWLGAGFYGFDCTHALNATLHNLYLQVLVEFGVVGLVALLALMFVSARLLIRSVQAQPDQYRFGVLWSVVALGVFTFVEAGYAFPFGQWVSLWLAIIVFALVREQGQLKDEVVLAGGYWSKLLPVLGVVLVALFLSGLYSSWWASMDWIASADLGGYRPRLWLDDCGGH